MTPGRPMTASLPPYHPERPFSAFELEDIRQNWTEHPERFSYMAGRWLATLDAAPPAGVLAGKPERTYTQAQHDESERQLRDCVDCLVAAGVLDEAWAAATELSAALPGGGYGVALVPFLDDRHPDSGQEPDWRYHAYPSRVYIQRGRRGQPDHAASGTHEIWSADGYGPTPAAALLALAAALGRSGGTE